MFRGLENDCIGLCKPLFDIHVATLQKHKLELWCYCHKTNNNNNNNNNNKSDTLYIPHLQFSSRPQEAYWWQYLGPCLHHQDQSAQGKRRSPHCKDLWQVAIQFHMDPYTWTTLQCSISVVMLVSFTICRAQEIWLGLPDQFPHGSWVSSMDLRDSRVLICYLCTRIFVSLVGTIKSFRLTHYILLQSWHAREWSNLRHNRWWYCWCQRVVSP